MNDLKREIQTRRELFRSLGRIFALSGLGIVGAISFRRTIGHSDQACNQPNPCQSCFVFNSCTLPLALEAKKPETEKKHG